MIKAYRHTGDALKIVSDAQTRNSHEMRVGGYLVRYTDETKRDLHEEFFDKTTDFWLERGYPVKGSRVLLEHGLDDFAKVMPIGLIDLMKEDEIGLYVEARLNDRAEYERMLKEMRYRKAIDLSVAEISAKAELATKAIHAIVETGKVQWSSGALPQSVIVDESNGHIKSWAIIEGSLTFTPAEAIGTEIAPIKSALEQLSDFLGTPPAISDAAIDAQHKEPTTENAVSSKSTSITPNKGTSKMTIQEYLSSLVAGAQELLAGLGNSEPEAMAMAGEVEEEMKADVEALPEEEKAKALDEELVKAWHGKMTAIVIAKHEKNQADKARFANVGKNASQSALDAYKRNQPATEANALGGFSGGSKKTRIEAMQDRAYAGWQAEDFSFAIALGKMASKTAKELPFTPNQKFYRAFADTATKAFNANTLYLSQQAYDGIQAIKSDELDYSTQAGYGDEWVPTVWADTIWEKPRLDNVIQNLFASVEMPSNPYEYPVESTDPTVFLVGETKNEAVLALDISTSPIPDSKIATAKVTFTASKFGTRIMYSAELEEDGLRRLVPQFRAQATRAMQDRIDYVGINGDTATTLNVNSDGETITDTTRAYLAYNGLIKQAIVTATTNKVDANGASPSLTLMRSTRSKLGAAEGTNPENLAWIMDYSTYIKLLSDDVVVSVDKYGPAATVVTGELGRIDGIRVFVSAQMALADADGKVTQTSNTVDRGRAILVHVPTWMFGYRRRIAQDVSYLPYYDSYILTLTMRNHFVPRTAANGTLQSTDDSTAVLYNIGV